MTDTRFAVGSGTAYVTDEIVALGAGGGVDDDAMALCATADWEAIVARAGASRLDAIVMHQGDRVHVAVRDNAVVVVTTVDGEHRFVGAETWNSDTIEGAHHVMLMRGGIETPDEPVYRTDGGAMPASVVSRRLVARPDLPLDPFDALFGHTVVRSVETAAVRRLEPDADRRVVGVLIFTTGERVLLDEDVLVGRNPRPAGDDDAPRRSVKMSHPGVSRRHAAIHLDRWEATIEDLGSTNGTTITLPGAAPRTLQPGATSVLPIGATVELGTDVSFTLEAAA